MAWFPVTRMGNSGVSYSSCCIIVMGKLIPIHAPLYLGGLASHMDKN